MAWIKDIYAGCEKCHNAIWMDGNSISDAKKNAKLKGWRLRPLTCPLCLSKERSAKLGITSSGEQYDVGTSKNADSAGTVYAFNE